MKNFFTLLALIGSSVATLHAADYQMQTCCFEEDIKVTKTVLSDDAAEIYACFLYATMNKDDVSYTKIKEGEVIPKGTGFILYTYTNDVFEFGEGVAVAEAHNDLVGILNDKTFDETTGCACSKDCDVCQAEYGTCGSSSCNCENGVKCYILTYTDDYGYSWQGFTGTTLTKPSAYIPVEVRCALTKDDSTITSVNAINDNQADETTSINLNGVTTSATSGLLIQNGKVIFKM